MPTRKPRVSVTLDDAVMEKIISEQIETGKSISDIIYGTLCEHYGVTYQKPKNNYPLVNREFRQQISSRLLKIDHVMTHEEFERASKRFRSEHLHLIPDFEKQHLETGITLSQYAKDHDINIANFSTLRSKVYEFLRLGHVPSKKTIVNGYEIDYKTPYNKSYTDIDIYVPKLTYAHLDFILDVGREQHRQWVRDWSAWLDAHNADNKLTLNDFAEANDHPHSYYCGIRTRLRRFIYVNLESFQKYCENNDNIMRTAAQEFWTAETDITVNVCHRKSNDIQTITKVI